MRDEIAVGIPPATGVPRRRQPTAPASVTARSPLAELNLNWSERDLPERERTRHVHRLHPYLGKFIPQLAEVFLRRYFRPGQTVLDPFAGSGTTLVQANELGIHAVGYDVSAFNVLLARAKAKRYDLGLVRREILDILDRVRHAAGADRLGRGPGPAPAGRGADGDYLQRWFAPQALRELIAYRDLIDRYENQEILQVIASRSARSARLTTHYDLDFPRAPQTEPYWCHKHGRICAPTSSAYQFLKRYSLDTIRRLEEFAACRTRATIVVHHDDSRRADMPRVDGVLTSPPYVGLIDYHEQHRYAYELLGLPDCSTSEIGPASRGTGRRAEREYQESMAQVFRRACASMPSGSPLIVVAADPRRLYDELGRRCEVETEAVLRRQVNRRTGRRSGEFYESIFVWRKP